MIQAQLQWPTGLSLSPLDGSLHFIDDRLILKLTADMKVKVVAGSPLHCHANKAREFSNITIEQDEPISKVLDIVLCEIVGMLII